MGQIKVKKNVGGIEGLCIIEPTLHGDSRGYFMETYNKNDMAEAGLTMFRTISLPPQKESFVACIFRNSTHKGNLSV